MRRSCHHSCVKTSSHSSYCPSRQIHHTITPRCGWLNLNDCGNLERYHNNREAHLLNLKRIREFQKYPIRPQLTPLQGVRITTESVNGRSEFPLKQEDKNRGNNHSHTKDTSCSLKSSRVKQFSEKKPSQPVLYHVHWMRGHNIATALPKYTATFRSSSKSGKPIVRNIIAQNAKLSSSLFRRLNGNQQLSNSNLSIHHTTCNLKKNMGTSQVILRQKQKNLRSNTVIETVFKPPSSSETSQPLKNRRIVVILPVPVHE
ncbi:uncharacterized protein LOC108951006 [Ciona intestinalis]